MLRKLMHKKQPEPFDGPRGRWQQHAPTVGLLGEARQRKRERYPLTDREGFSLGLLASL